jgi:hypothetical protein
MFVKLVNIIKNLCVRMSELFFFNFSRAYLYWKGAYALSPRIHHHKATIFLENGPHNRALSSRKRRYLIVQGFVKGLPINIVPHIFRWIERRVAVALLDK